jgi:hypothetical protein
MKKKKKLKINRKIKFVYFFFNTELEVIFFKAQKNKINCDLMNLSKKIFF